MFKKRLLGQELSMVSPEFEVLAWFAISVAIDLVMFSSGPMKMTIIDYIKDIGITYLIIPIITIGLALQANKGMAKGV